MELSFDNVDKFCANIDLNEKSPVVNLSGYTFFTPFGLVYLGQFLRYHNSREIKFTFNLPEDAIARNYLSQQRFWYRFNFNPETATRERLQGFDDNTSVNDIVDIENQPNIAEDTANHILRILVNNIVNINYAAVAEIATELVDNFAQHADNLLATLLIQYYPDRHEIVIGVGDCGIGIRSSLCKNLQHEYLAVLPHYEAALKAFEPMVSRKDERGVGLTQVREQVLKAQGQIICATGDGYVKINRQKTETGIMGYNLRGAQIEVAIPEGGWVF
jgi:hypothetical protein